MNAPKKWIYKSPLAESVAAMSQALNISKAAASVLVNRGITSVEEARLFINPDMSSMYNPFLMPDIFKAVDRIRQALDRKEKILVYGDRDVDGVTSTCIMVRTLRSLGADVIWYVPSNEGYGMSIDGVKKHADMGVKLIISVDCGITGLKEIEYARSLELDCIVTDHHEPTQDGLPDALAVVDPKIPASRYPFKDLAGCAVTFKVCQALMLSYGKYYNEELVFAVFTENGATAFITKNGLGQGEMKIFSSGLSGLKDFIGERRIVVQDDISKQKLAALKPAGRICDIHDEFRENEGLPPAADASVLARQFRDCDTKADLRMNFFVSDNLDLVTLGTIADIMPLNDENRVLVKEGLKYLTRSKKPGIRALLDNCLRKKPDENTFISAKSVSWDLTPVLNAAGRRGRADLAVNLIFSQDIYDASEYLDKIIDLNTQRKALQAENLDVFMSLVSRQCDTVKDKILVVTAAGVEHGVTGIIASQIVRKYNRPVFLLILEGEEAVGAVRSIPGFDVVSVLDKLKDLLVKYGGHAQAAGLTVKKENVEAFTTRLRQLAQEEITYDMLVPSVDIDAELEFSELNMTLLDELDKLEPFGSGNPPPVFSLTGVKLNSLECMGGRNEHLKLRISKNGSAMVEALGWGMGDIAQELKSTGMLDLAVQIEYNNWKSKKSLQVVICDLKMNIM